MKNASFLTMFLFFALALSGCAGTFQDGTTRYGERADVTVTGESGGIRGSAGFKGYSERVFQKDNNSYKDISISNLGETSEIGKPKLPVYGTFIAIPANGEVSLKIEDLSSEIRNDCLVLPVQEPIPEVDGYKSEFKMDKEFYETNQLYPDSPVKIEFQGVMRGVRIAMLRIYPFQYNPAEKKLIYNRSFRFEIDYGEGSFLADGRFLSPSFADLQSSFLVNNNKIKFSKVKASSDIKARLEDEPGCEFLIITPPEFESSAQLLKDWKIRKGIDTKVITTQVTGSTSAQIKSYIKNAYDEWNPAPSFVLLLGDAEYIPPCYQTMHPQTSIYPTQQYIGTDLYYGTVQGDDIYPDIAVGRIPVDRAIDADKAIQNIISYEKTPPQDENFYKKASCIAQFQDYDYDGYEDRRFCLTAWEVHQFLEEKGFSVDELFAVRQTQENPAFWSKTYWPARGSSTQSEPIASYLLKPGFPWNASSTNIKEVFNQGRFLVLHRDHGDITSWGTPHYNTANAASISNGVKLPVLLSINCETGWFDNETDDPLSDTADYVKCLCEMYFRNSNGGAISVIGSTRISYSGYNDRLIWGIADAIWPDFIGDYGYAGNPGKPQYAMGHMLNYGKLYMASIYGSSSIFTKTEFEEFNLLGDPTLEIRTALPSIIKPTISSVIVGATQLSIKANEPGALVCISKDGRILGKGISDDSGVAIISVPALESGSLNVTITRHNCIPYEGSIDVFAPVDLIGSWMDKGINYLNRETGEWVWLNRGASSIASGDIDGDGYDDIIGNWEDGLYVRYSKTGSWIWLNRRAENVAAGDIDGDGYDDVIGNWEDGLYVRYSKTGSWIWLNRKAESIASGDIDGDGYDDVIGNWEDGLYARYSKTGSWIWLNRKAENVASGDIDGDGFSDVAGNWDGGLYVRYSKTGSWIWISDRAVCIAMGKMKR